MAPSGSSSRPKVFKKLIGSEPIDILLLDADAVPESVSQVIKEIHDVMPGLRTILIISPTAKDEIMKIIGANLVKGIVVKPFTKDAVSRYVEKLVHSGCREAT